jgi:membrane-associated phospholipid phosphatase
MLAPRSGRGELVVCVATLLTGLTALLVLALLTDSLTLWILLSLLGEELVYVGLAIAVTYLANPQVGFLALVSVLLSGSLNIMLKNSLNIPRPPPELWRVPASGPGFPSGHVQISTTFWTSISLSLRNRYVAALSALTITSIAVSRVALRVHSVGDVVAGVALGLSIAALSYYVSKVSEPRHTVLALSLISSSISCYCLLLRYEASTSAAVAGLSLGVALSSQLIDGVSKKISNFSILRRAISLLLVGLPSAVTTMAEPPNPYLGLPIYISLGVLISVAPLAISHIRRRDKGLSLDH